MVRIAPCDRRERPFCGFAECTVGSADPEPVAEVQVVDLLSGRWGKNVHVEVELRRAEHPVAVFSHTEPQPDGFHWHKAGFRVVDSEFAGDRCDSSVGGYNQLYGLVFSLRGEVPT